MKNPNGYGSVSKLPGKRRKPWRARKTAGWEYVRKDNGMVVEKPRDEEIAQGMVYRKQKYTNIGYFVKRKDAILALATYNNLKQEGGNKDMLFKEVYANWSLTHFPKISDSNIRGYKAAFELCGSLHDMKIRDISLSQLQLVIDQSGKNTPTLRKVKNLWGLMWDYCAMHEIISQSKRGMIKYVDTERAGNPNGFKRVPFAEEEIKKLWKYKEDKIVSIALLLIYTGCRISELLDLKKENINIEEKYFKIIASKTEAGIRTVPIHKKVLPIIKKWDNHSSGVYLLMTESGRKFKYKNFCDTYWNPTMENMGMQHRPHDTRHTCVSLLAREGVDERIIKRIVGHKGEGVTETVYTHFDNAILLESINKIKL